MLNYTKFRKYIEFFVIYIYIRGFYLHEYILRDVFEMFKKIFKKLKNIRNKDDQVELTEEEAGLFNFIYFDADEQKRNFEEVLICIGLIVNKKGIPIDTRDTPRLNAAREIFNKKTFVKKDKLFVSASKKISGFLSKAQWENAVESYKRMLKHSVLLGLYVSLLESKTDFKYNSKLSYTKGTLASYSVQTRLCSTSVLDDDDKQMIADEYKRMTKYTDDNHSRSEYWIEKPKYEKAHKAYTDAEKTLLADLKSFKEHPTTEGLKKLLNDCVDYISCYDTQYGWQWKTKKHLLLGNLNSSLETQTKRRQTLSLPMDKTPRWNDRNFDRLSTKLIPSLNECDVPKVHMELEESRFKETLQETISALYFAVPAEYTEFIDLLNDYTIELNSLKNDRKLEELHKIIEKCPANINFNQQPKFDNVTPGTAVFPKID